MECQFLAEKVKGQGHRTSKNLHCNLTPCLLTGVGSSADSSGADCKLGLTIVRLNLLSTPETLGSWMDGRVLCRHSEPSSFLVFMRLPMLPEVGDCGVVC